MDTFKDLLKKPSVDSWKAIVKIGRCLAGTPTWQGFADAVLLAVSSWPKELVRAWPDGIGPPEFKAQVEWRVREVDIYGHYAQKISTDPRLQLDGKQRVWLERRFTGGVVPASVAKQVISTLLEAIKKKDWAPVREAISVLAGSIRNTGKVGTADLTGGLILRHTRKGTLEVRLELEIKVGDGKQRPEQLARQNSVNSRGGLYLCSRSVEEAVQGILQFIAENE